MHPKETGPSRGNARPRELTADEQPTPPAYRDFQAWLSVRSATVAELRRRGLVPADADALRRPSPAGTFARQFERVSLLLEIRAALGRAFSLTDADRELVARLVDGACRRRERGLA